MPIALPTPPACNDNGAPLDGVLRRRAGRQTLWDAVRSAARDGARLDYLAPGVMRIVGFTFAPR